MFHLFFLLVFSVFVSPAFAQETLFNVPNGEITDEGEHYLQVQSTTEFPTSSLNLTYDYGLSEGLEVGLNIFDVTSAPKEEGGGSTDVLANAQWTYKLNERWEVFVGGQLGRSQEPEWAGYGYINVRRTFFEEAFMVAGIFQANNAYLEGGNGFWHAGIEWPIIPKKLAFEAEYINGTSNISNGVVGLGYEFSEQWEITLGAQIPGVQSDNDWGAVLEVTMK